MAKKQNLTDIFAKTTGPQPGPEPAGNTDLDEGNIRALGVGLREGEVMALDQIAGEINISRNALLRFAVRYFLLQYRAGKVDLNQFVETPPPQKKKLRLPGL